MSIAGGRLEAPVYVDSGIAAGGRYWGLSTTTDRLQQETISDLPTHSANDALMVRLGTMAFSVNNTPRSIQTR